MTSILLGVYVLGVAIGLFAIDARGWAKVGLALLWPLGPLAFVVTVSILLLSLPIAFPVVGTIVLALLITTIVFVFR